MENQLFIYNTISRKKEKFESIIPQRVGMYVCGPTVYGDAHLGHARPAISFDVVFRYLQHLGYKVRYVRNITDVGHLENDSDSGEDKITKKARLEQLEPMEIVQYYVNRYHRDMEALNVLPPSIEPHASGHIIEQLEMIEKIFNNGYAYLSNGSVYFDVLKYNEKHQYGKLSGRQIEDLYEYTRQLQGQTEKKSAYDFALWKKANPEHIMRWNSRWSEGFPGWHLECSAMGTKYLGEYFDIHGGGLDLQFPHHECEIAQNIAANQTEGVKYWMHNNMITINGQKMSKSLKNFISLEELFSGQNNLLLKPYSPMTVRFFILQAHYRSPLDFSNEALSSSEKGFERLMNAVKTLEKIVPAQENTVDVENLRNSCYEAINDDLNTPILIANLFDGVKIINSIYDGKEKINQENLLIIKQIYNDFVFNILGLKDEAKNSVENQETLKNVVDLLLNIRLSAKQNKDFATSDKIRQELGKLGFEIKDKKDGFEWELKK